VQKNQRNHQNQRTKPVSSSEHGRSNGLEISASNAERICGFHALESVLGQRPQDVLGIWYAHVRSDQRIQTLLAKAEQNQIKTHSTTRRALDEAAEGTRHQGVIALVRLTKPRQQEELFDLLDQLVKKDELPLLLILDQIQDPHNLGACLRSAEGAGVNAVVLPKDSSAPVTEVVRRVAAGAVDRMPVFYVTNLVRLIDALKERGIWITGTADEAKAMVYQTNLTGSTAIVMGAEGKGLRRLTRERCDNLVSIPMSGKTSSLNVSVATGIVLFEAVRQRLDSSKSDS